MAGRRVGPARPHCDRRPGRAGCHRSRARSTRCRAPDRRGPSHRSRRGGARCDRGGRPLRFRGLGACGADALRALRAVCAVHAPGDGKHAGRGALRELARRADSCGCDGVGAGAQPAGARDVRSACAEPRRLARLVASPLGRPADSIARDRADSGVERPRCCPDAGHPGGR